MLSCTRGLTLIGLLIAMVIGAFILTAMSRLFTGSVESFTAEEQLLDIRHTANTTIERLRNIFMEAGVDLPLDENVIYYDNGDIIVKVNRSGAYYQFAKDITTNEVVVDNGNAFAGENSVWKKNYGENPVSLSLSSVADNTLIFTAEHNFLLGDELYLYETHRYHYNENANKLTVSIDGNSPSLIASNINDISVEFYYDPTSKNVTEAWDSMRVCSLYVNVESPIKKKSGNPMEIEMNKIFYLRNKIPIGG
ncbi:MAG: hypothetical protein GF350_01635 [Chitinivibrionales bacterium]|nr:hypothetical protein [Chitinivibrionales bacterium]